MKIQNDYLARYLSHTCQSQSLTHLIIYEVYEERSIDADLCWNVAISLSNSIEF